jgi:uncharacterized protein YjeT (DUF2065 family)
MNNDAASHSLQTLEHIKSVMDRSARVLSLSGWSGIWAGIIALCGATAAYYSLSDYYGGYLLQGGFNVEQFKDLRNQLFLIALATLVLAVLGAFYFTYRKHRSQNLALWNSASRNMLTSISIPLLAGGVLIVAFLKHSHWNYIASTTLIFYGLALINGSKYTLSDIKYLGLIEVILGCIGLFLPPQYDLYLWALGFGILHIVYGIIMWRKYDSP